MGNFQEPPLDKLTEALAGEIARSHDSHADIASMFEQICATPAKCRPHPVYVIGLDDLSGPQALDKARLAGWRFLISHPGGRNYAVELEPGRQEGSFAFAELDKGPFVDGLCAILENDGIRDKFDSGACRPALLRLNALRVSALWLRHNGKPARDNVIVIPPAPDYLEPWPAVYLGNAFQSALRKAAKRKIKFERKFI